MEILEDELGKLKDQHQQAEEQLKEYEAKHKQVNVHVL